MTKILSVDGKRVKAFVFKSGLSKEKVVVHVQDTGHPFSLAGLDKIFRSELPKRDTEVILGIIANSCGCQISDFAEFEKVSA